MNLTYTVQEKKPGKWTIHMLNELGLIVPRGHVYGYFLSEDDAIEKAEYLKDMIPRRYERVGGEMVNQTPTASVSDPGQ